MYASCRSLFPRSLSDRESHDHCWGEAEEKLWLGHPARTTWLPSHPSGLHICPFRLHPMCLPQQPSGHLLSGIHPGMWQMLLFYGIIDVNNFRVIILRSADVCSTNKQKIQSRYILLHSMRGHWVNVTCSFFVFFCVCQLHHVSSRAVCLCTLQNTQCVTEDIFPNKTCKWGRVCFLQGRNRMSQPHLRQMTHSFAALSLYTNDCFCLPTWLRGCWSRYSVWLVCWSCPSIYKAPSSLHNDQQSLVLLLGILVIGSQTHLKNAQAQKIILITC